MNSKTAATLFCIGCVGFALAFFLRHASAVSKERTDSAKIVELSTEVTNVTEELKLQKALGAKLGRELEDTAKEVVELNGQLNSTKSELVKVKSDAATAAEIAKVEIAKKDAEITKLESQTDVYTRQMAGLNTQITNLENRITETSRLLAESKTDNKILQEELARLQKEKAELERQFNNLMVLKEQVAKLKEELDVARRLEYFKQGLYNTLPKGAQALTEFTKKPVTPLPGGTNYQLNVTISRTGGVSNVTSVTPNPTNRPAGR